MENPFKSLAGMFGKSGGSALGIDIGSSAIEVVQLRRQAGRAVLETYGELALGPYAGVDIGNAVKLTTSKTAEALLDILREAKVSTKNCGIAMPITTSLVTLIELPLVDEKQFAEMVPIEARKYVPVPISEVVMDWWVIPKEEGGASYPVSSPGAPEMKSGRMVDVLLAVIHNESVSSYQQLIKESGLQSSFYEIEVFSAIRAVSSQEPLPVLIVDLGATTTKLYVVERGIVRNSHVINRGAQDITLSIARSLSTSVTEGELTKRNAGLDPKGPRKDVYTIASTNLSYIFTEANRLLTNFEKRSGKIVSKIILTGGGALLGGILPFARSFFETETVLADPFSKVDYPAFLEGVLKKAGPEFAVAMGIALRKLQEGQ